MQENRREDEYMGGSETEKSRSRIQNTKFYDSSSKIIFDDPVLCAQFLRDYVDLPILKDVRPEDIEDVSERYVPLIGEERNADTVKRINLYGRMPLFLISLIEHKTEVDYNVSMQIFRYMVYIWDDYEKEMERAYNKGISKTKNFKYPPILPIVYYEGKENWTAPFELKDRILCSEFMQQYIPNYRYQLVELKDYSSQILMEKQDEISLIMMINKIQNRQDMQQLEKLPPEVFDEILQDTPDYLVDLIAKIFRTLLIQLNIPEQEAEEMVGKVKVRKMGQLWANADFDDIRQGWQKVKDARKKAEKWEEQAKQFEEQAKQFEEQAKQSEEQAKQFEEQAKQSEEQAKQSEEYAKHYKEETEQLRKQAEQYQNEIQKKDDILEESIRRMIGRMKVEKKTHTEIRTELAEVFSLSEKEAEQKIKRYGEKQ